MNKLPFGSRSGEQQIKNSGVLGPRAQFSKNKYLLYLYLDLADLGTLLGLGLRGNVCIGPPGEDWSVRLDVPSSSSRVPLPLPIVFTLHDSHARGRTQARWDVGCTDALATIKHRTSKHKETTDRLGVGVGREATRSRQAN
eukprot:scaffold94608_cov32-Tisochrysis_lutea.AAC.1